MTNEDSNSRERFSNSKGRQLPPARNFNEVFNSAKWWLEYRNYFLTEGELRKILLRKTDNQQWITDCIQRLYDAVLLQSNENFTQSFIRQSFFGDYGSSYIIKKLEKKELSRQFVIEQISSFKISNNIDEQEILNRYINARYQVFTESIEKIQRRLEARGFHWKVVKNAIAQHPANGTLKSSVEIKASKVDLMVEIPKYAKKGKGLKFITNHLRSLKVDVSNIDAIVGELVLNGRLDFFSSAVHVLSKYVTKKNVDLATYQGRSAAYSHLSSKGFCSEEIKFAISEVNEIN